MEYTVLGNTGMSVSRICLGCMPFGLDTSEKYDWSLDEETSTEIIERAVELGINFFDTANSYSWGDSERVLGSALSEYDRTELVVASKVFFGPEDAHPNAAGLSRKTIQQELQHSLDRLGMDVIDLYQIHRWDYDTPIEETLTALNDLITSGSIRYIGASSMWAYQFANALHSSDRLGLRRFVTMQNHYNLVYREEEREMLPFCAQENVGVLPWSPLARGFLARPLDHLETTERGDVDDKLYDLPYATGGGEEINERVAELARGKDRSMAQIALAWLLHKEWVDAPIVGTSSVEHLEEAVEAIDIDLTASEIQYLEEPYEPVSISGHE